MSEGDVYSGCAARMTRPSATKERRPDSTWQIVHRPLFARRSEVLAEYGSRREAEQHLAGYKKKLGPAANVYVSEHLAPLSLDAYMDRGGR